MASFASLEMPLGGEGWGPGELPKELHEIPFAPFSKSERLGRIADWTSSAPHHHHHQDRRQHNQPKGAVVFQAKDEDSFHVVDSKSMQKSGRGGQRTRPQGPPKWPMRRDDNRDGRRDFRGNKPGQQPPRSRFQQQQQRRRRPDPRSMVVREPSVQIEDRWQTCGQVLFSALHKVSSPLPEAETIKEFGVVGKFDPSFNLMTVKGERKLQKQAASVRARPSVHEDKVITQLVKEQVGNVFATDTVLAALMASGRSQLPWDLVAIKQNGVIFFDKRPGQFDELTVAETALEPPAEEAELAFNSWGSLAREATYVNDMLAQQVLKKEGSHKLGERDGNAPPVGAFRYRKFTLDASTTLVCRCEVDGAVQGNNGVELTLVRALNEWHSKSSGVDWRKQLDPQRGAVMATEIRNNSFKLGQWAVKGILSGVGQVKLGFVSRVNPRDPNQHTILGMQHYEPNEFAQKISLSVNNIWGVFKEFVDMLRRCPDGQFHIVKDPNAAQIKMYRVPGADGEEADEDDDDDYPPGRDDDDDDDDEGDDDDDEGDDDDDDEDEEA